VTESRPAWSRSRSGPSPTPPVTDTESDLGEVETPDPRFPVGYIPGDLPGEAEAREELKRVAAARGVDPASLMPRSRGPVSIAAIQAADAMATRYYEELCAIPLPRDEHAEMGERFKKYLSEMRLGTTQLQQLGA
jgi:hypothetical protein